MNIELAVKVLRACQALGVSEYCLCAGARNSPLVFILAKAHGIKIYHFFEERSASFFALGRIKATGLPVAVVTTSGTAVAELLPAAVEATYSGLPILLITADRPRIYRGSGAPQAIEQMGIFSHYVQTTWDIESLEDQMPLESWAQKQPLQINVCFDEPLIDGEIQSLDLSAKISPEVAIAKELALVPAHRRKVVKPFVIVGGLRQKDREAVISFLENLQVPIYAEGISGLRGEPRLQKKLLLNAEPTVSRCFENKLCETVLRLGSVPTLRFWRDLEAKFSNLHVYSVSNDEWTGLSRRVHHTLGFQNLPTLEVQGLSAGELGQVQDWDQTAEAEKGALLQRLPLSEPALVKNLASALVGKSVYLGNSLPIREWDLVAPANAIFADLEANRGANGIDGQISTFLGWSLGGCHATADGRAAEYQSAEGQSAFEYWAVIGDLTALYDLSALWIVKSLSETEAVSRRIVIINNQGGQIFKNIFKNEAFLNSHNVGFQKWAEMWGWDYQLWTEIPRDLQHPSKPLPKNLIIELKPSGPESDQFWQANQKK